MEGGDDSGSIPGVLRTLIPTPRLDYETFSVLATFAASKCLGARP